MNITLMDPWLLETFRQELPTYTFRNIMRSFDDEIKAIITRTDPQDRQPVTLYKHLFSHYNDMTDIRAQQPTCVTMHNERAEGEAAETEKYVI